MKLAEGLTLRAENFEKWGNKDDKKFFSSEIRSFRTS